MATVLQGQSSIQASVADFWVAHFSQSSEAGRLDGVWKRVNGTGCRILRVGLPILKEETGLLCETQHLNGAFVKENLIRTCILECQQHSNMHLRTVEMHILMTIYSPNVELLNQQIFFTQQK